METEYDRKRERYPLDDSLPESENYYDFKGCAKMETDYKAKIAALTERKYTCPECGKTVMIEENRIEAKCKCGLFVFRPLPFNA